MSGGDLELSGPEMLEGHLYDYPAYYDLIFGSDCAAELLFFEDCFEKFSGRTVRRLFEPACGTGRLLYRLARSGYTVAGNDLNPHAVAYCNARLERAGLTPSATVGDMSSFRVRKKVDAAFNTINSVRHLGSETAARRIGPRGVLAQYFTRRTRRSGRYRASLPCSCMPSACCH